MFDKTLLRQSVLFGLSLFGIQGTIYFLQLTAATQMPASAFAQVRIVESLVAVLSLLQTLGIPSASLPRIAISESASERSSILRQCIFGIMVISFFTSASFAGALHFGIVRRTFDFPLASILLLSGLLSFRLLFVTTMQAQQRFGRLALLSLLSCGVCLGAYGLLRITAVPPLRAWIISRTLLELCLCLSFILAETISTGLHAFSIGFSSTRSALGSLPALLSDSAPVGFSLLFRSLIENGPVLLLASVSASPQTVANIGLLITLGTVSLLPASILQGAALPRLSLLLGPEASAPDAARRALAFVARYAALPVVLMTAILFVAPTAVPWFTFMTLPAILLAVLVVASKSLTSSFGAFLLAATRFRTIFLTNSLVLLFGVALAVTVRNIPQLASFFSALLLITAIEVFSAVLYGRAAWNRASR